jgi:hypothetical protein
MAVTTLALGYVPQAGINYTHITDSSADWTDPLLPNNTYFYNRADKLVYFKDPTGVTRPLFPAGLGFTPENTANKGVVNGYAGLDGTGRVPAGQLPSYVDDVIEVANFVALPPTGEAGKIYITLDTNKVYRWAGTIYVEVSQPNAVWGGITGTLGSQTDLQNALNAKQNTITLTTTGTSGPATLTGSTLNIPQYAAGGSNLNTWVVNGGFFNATLAASNTFLYGHFYGVGPQDIFNARPSRQIFMGRTGVIRTAVIMTAITTFSSTSPPNSMQIQIVVNNGTPVVIDTNYSMSSGAYIGNSRQDVYPGLNIPVTVGQFVEIRLVCPAWATAPTGVSQIINLYIDNV